MATSRCPTCGKSIPVTPSERPKSYPFCSKRCQMVDLYKWLDEEYCISTPIESPEQVEELLKKRQQDTQNAGPDAGDNGAPTPPISPN